MRRNDERDPWDIEDDIGHTPERGETDSRFSGYPQGSAGDYRPSGRFYRQSLRRSANAVGGGLLLYYLIILVWSYISAFCEEFFPDMFSFLGEWGSLTLDILNVSLSALIQLAPCIFIMRMLSLPAKAAFPGRPPRLAVPGTFCALGMSIIGIYLSAIIGGIIESSFGAAPTMPDLGPPYGMAATIVYMISIAVMPAILEEMLFRGVILQCLRPFGDGFALIASALLFALLHGNLVQAPNAFVVGLVLGYFVLRSGSIFTSMIMHFTNNTIAAALSIANLYLSPEQMNIFNFLFLPVYLSLGILGIIIMTTKHGGFIRPSRGDSGIGELAKYGYLFTAPLLLIFTAVTAWIITRYF